MRYYEDQGCFTQEIKICIHLIISLKQFITHSLLVKLDLKVHLLFLDSFKHNIY